MEGSSMEGSTTVTRNYVVSLDDLQRLDMLERITGMNRSEIVREGIRMVYAAHVKEAGTLPGPDDADKPVLVEVG